MASTLSFEDDFAKAYESRFARPPKKRPKSLEEMFDGMHDPDDYGKETLAKLEIAKAIVQRTSTVLENDPLIDRVTIYPGDVDVRGDFTVACHTLVLGNLRVEGCIQTDPAHNILMVAGEIECEGLQLLRAYAFVTGDIRARQCAMFTCYGLTWCLKTISTDLYLSDDSCANHDLGGEEVSTNIRARHAIVGDFQDEAVTAQFAKVLRPEIIENENFPYSIFDAICAKSPIAL
jgi:hypothetical protein